jgi:hypothetical protein
LTFHVAQEGITRTLADVTAVVILLEAVFTVQCAHKLRTPRLFLAFADVAAIVIFLPAILAVHPAPDLWTFRLGFIALADVTTIFILLEAILTIHFTHHI